MEVDWGARLSKRVCIGDAWAYDKGFLDEMVSLGGILLAVAFSPAYNSGSFAKGKDLGIIGALSILKTYETLTIASLLS